MVKVSVQPKPDRPCFSVQGFYALMQPRLMHH